MQIVIPVVCVVLAAAIVAGAVLGRGKKAEPVSLQSKTPEPSGTAWTATPFTNEQGQV